MIDPKDILGKEFNKAENAVQKQGYTLREVQKDGFHLAVDCMYDPTRVNVVTDNGVVTSVCNIG